jgi:hypothetical protein
MGDMCRWKYIIERALTGKGFEDADRIPLVEDRDQRCSSFSVKTAVNFRET